MLNQIFPKTIDNHYQGSPIAKYAFILLTILTVIRSLIHMFSSEGGAQDIAHIPLDSFQPASNAVIVLIFSLWGLSQLLMSVVYIVVIWRYQQLIPFMYILIFIEYAMRFILTHMKPILTTKIPPGALADHVMWPLAALLFFLSLKVRPTSSTR